MQITNVQFIPEYNFVLAFQNLQRLGMMFQLRVMLEIPIFLQKKFMNY